LSDSVAAETSAFFTANVPPNPQQWSLFEFEGPTRPSPRTLVGNRTGFSATCNDYTESEDLRSVTVCGFPFVPVGVGTPKGFNSSG
jgi:hypothetical protein